METIVLGGGCFWCTEAIFQRLKGVESVIPGYANSRIENPSYEDVYMGKAKAVESIQITFDSQIIPLQRLLDIFWHTHNPTTKNQQGYDKGEEYRSVIFYRDESQKGVAEKSKRIVEKEKAYKDPIVTSIEPFQNFFPAEDYHRDFYNKSRSSPYCTFIIDPKIANLLKEFSKDVKEEYKES